MQHKILIADDDQGIRDTLKTVLKSEGYDISTASNGEDTLKIIDIYDFDIVLLDYRMPDCLGLELIGRINEMSPETIIIMMTAYGTIKTAVESVKLGAYDFITKPFDIDEIIQTIKRVIEVKTLKMENEELKKMIKEENVVFKNIIGSSRNMEAVFSTIRKIVNYDVTVLIEGESGTGKELVAEAIHNNSSRRNEPFIKLNCAAIPDNLLESELFGYEKGAFTGATSTKLGRFELANKGTIFLDEIGDTSLNMQVKLLRVLQEKEFERIGGRHTIKTDVRVLAATNKNLKEEVKKKNFREDLFYRLNVFPIYLPPLRERREDIPELVNFFIKDFSIIFNKNIENISKEALDCLMNHNWPGNVRELKNTIEKSFLLSDDKIIQICHLPTEIQNTCVIDESEIKTDNEGVTLDELEEKHILKALIDSDWNQTKAAEILGIHRNTIREKIKRYRIKRKD